MQKRYSHYVRNLTSLPLMRYSRTAQDLASPRLARYYIDTSVWMDFYENRKDRFRPLGEWAFELFRKIRNEKGIVLYSKATLKELGRYYNPAQIKEIMQIVSNKGALLLVQINPEELREASALSKGLSIPFDDCLHAILARDNDAVMVTRDRHFEMLRNIAEIKKPEELI